jgi:hypothetical protein
MDEDTLRAMVRDALSRHLHGGRQPDATPAHPLVFTHHASHYRYGLPESGGPCLIEPSVQCNHCGYCQSHGH